MSMVQYCMRSPTGKRSRERERERERETAGGTLGKGERSGWDGGRFLLARKIFGGVFGGVLGFKFNFHTISQTTHPSHFLPLLYCKT